MYDKPKIILKQKLYFIYINYNLIYFKFEKKK